MNKRFISLFALIMLFALAFCVIATALSLDDLDPNTDVSGWAYSTQPGHMGTSSITYSFAYSSLYSVYNSTVISGKNLWGSNISLSYTSDSSNAVLVFLADDLSVFDAAAITDVCAIDNSTGHRTKCYITIDPNVFINCSEEVNAVIIAHELGHVFGLGHVDNSYSIMNPGYATTMSVTSNDIWGMKVVTHAHIHGTLFMGTYEVVNASYHDITCNSCHGKIRRVHAPNALGVCACGYTGPFLYP